MRDAERVSHGGHGEHGDGLGVAFDAFAAIPFLPVSPVAKLLLHLVFHFRRLCAGVFADRAHVVNFSDRDFADFV